MGFKSEHFGTVRVGIICGGDITDKASDQSCNQKVIFPLEHNPDGVKQEHLAFSPLHRSPDRDTQQSFPGTHDPGSLVYALKLPGSNQCLILGQANDLFNSGAQSGNKDLFSNDFFQEVFKRTIDIRIPPNIEEKTLADGVKVRTMKEKKDLWSHSLTQGLPTHASLFPITGFPNPAVKDVPTAKQHFNEIQTNDMMGQMPGDIMSLGKMLQGLMGGMGGGGAGGGAGGGGSPSSGSGSTSTDTSNMSTYTRGNTSPTISHLSPELQNAVLSASYLIQDFEGSSGSSTVVLGERVHSNTYMENANTLISQITCIDDLMNVLHRLRWDTSLFGQDKLEPVTFTVDTVWGTGIQTLHANGSLEFAYANTANVAQTQSDYQQSMSSSDSMPSTGAGDNMFGGSSSNMFDMFKRLSPIAEKMSKQMTDKLNTGDTAKKLQEIIKKTVQGGNPLSPDLFK